jgi:hypothetical protein
MTAPDAGPERGSDGASEGGSGLRNPAAAVRGLGAGTLVIETVVLLLAIQPIRMVGGGRGGAAVLAVCVLALAALGLAGLMRHGWAWYAAGALQALLAATGVLHWSLAVLGVLFGGVWLYVLHVRRTILRDRRPGPDDR